MSYRAEFSPEALGDLASLDSVVARRIFAKVSWLGENFENLVPEPLSGDLRGLFKLRVGSYRVIYSVDSSEHFIYVHMIGHRRDIYR